MTSVRVLSGFLLVAAGTTVAASGLNLIAHAQAPSGTNRGAVVESEAALPKDVFPDSRSRLPQIKREDLDERGKKAYDDAAANPSGVPQAVAAIKLHGSGADVRWASPLGRRLTED